MTPGEKPCQQKACALFPYTRPRTLTQIAMHLKNYTQPAHQRFIIRICFMVPIYAICSWLSLLHRPASLYLNTFRDC